MIPPELSSRIPYLRERYPELYLLDISELRMGELTSSCVVIRPLSSREFNSFSEDYLVDPMAAVMLLMRKAVIGGLDSIKDEKFKAGIDEFICSAITQVSGFASSDDLVSGADIAREESMRLESAIVVFICMAFSKLTPEDVDNMTFAEQMRHVALAEQILKAPFPYDDFLEPGKKKPELPPPPPEGYMSHGGGQPPQGPPEHHTMVTPDNLHKAMRETNEMLSRQ